jgi:hypothetical protein
VLAAGMLTVQHQAAAYPDQGGLTGPCLRSVDTPLPQQPSWLADCPWPVLSLLPAGLLRTYASDPFCNPEFIEGCVRDAPFRRLLMGLAFFHSVVQVWRGGGHMCAGADSLFSLCVNGQLPQAP